MTIALAAILSYFLSYCLILGIVYFSFYSNDLIIDVTSASLNLSSVHNFAIVLVKASVINLEM